MFQIIFGSGVGIPVPWFRRRCVRPVPLTRILTLIRNQSESASKNVRGRNTGRESLVNRQAGMPALQILGDIIDVVAARFVFLVGEMKRRAPERISTTDGVESAGGAEFPAWGAGLSALVWE